jgi:hypothetical protein
MAVGAYQWRARRRIEDAPGGVNKRRHAPEGCLYLSKGSWVFVRAELGPHHVMVHFRWQVRVRSPRQSPVSTRGSLEQGGDGGCGGTARRASPRPPTPPPERGRPACAAQVRALTPIFAFLFSSRASMKTLLSDLHAGPHPEPPQVCVHVLNHTTPPPHEPPPRARRSAHASALHALACQAADGGPLPVARTDEPEDLKPEPAAMPRTAALDAYRDSAHAPRPRPLALHGAPAPPSLAPAPACATNTTETLSAHVLPAAPASPQIRRVPLLALPRRVGRGGGSAGSAGHGELLAEEAGYIYIHT